MCVPSHSIYTLGLLVTILSLVRCAQAQRCYWPDGTSVIQEEEGYWAPCESGGRSCCRETEACLSNGLCFGGTYGLVSMQYSGGRGLN